MSDINFSAIAAKPTKSAPVVVYGGEGGIRTHGTREGTPVFKFLCLVFW
jgi:hypothetical protein